VQEIEEKITENDRKIQDDAIVAATGPGFCSEPEPVKIS
jgi:hypothetical protein